MKAFWLVWRPTGFPPRHKHETKESAEREAERLARTNPTETFVVLEAIGECRMRAVDWSRPEKPRDAYPVSNTRWNEPIVFGDDNDGEPE